MAWSFLLRTDLHVGAGVRQRLAELVAPIGDRVMLVTGARFLQASGLEAELRGRLEEAGITVAATGRIDGEPDVAAIDALADTVRAAEPQALVAIGGGAVLDAAKAAGGLATNPGSVRHYLEGIPEGGRPLTAAPLPLVALPTTAGTGSEVTKNAVVQVAERQVKRSLRDDRLLPRLALVDPDFLAHLSPYQAGCAGLDACAHLLESCLSTGANPMTDALAWPGLERAWSAVGRLAETGALDADGRAELALAATWGGVCLANARLGAAHGLVAAVCGRLPRIGHGHGVARLSGPALAVNARAVCNRGGVEATEKLERLSGLLTGGPADAEMARRRLEEVCDQLGIVPLRDCGLEPAHYEAIAAAPSGSIRSNPVELEQAELHEILAGA